MQAVVGAAIPLLVFVAIVVATQRVGQRPTSWLMVGLVALTASYYVATAERQQLSLGVLAGSVVFGTFATLEGAVAIRSIIRRCRERRKR